jgi:hypothetical protein
MLQINAFVGLNYRNIKITCNVNIFRVFAKITRFKETKPLVQRYFIVKYINTSS